MSLECRSPTDAELLQEYLDSGAEAAFEMLVSRHLNMVYSAALRRLGGNAAAAADLAQDVFAELARNASILHRHPALIGWLYTTTRRMAQCHLRAEFRRARREEAAARIMDHSASEALDTDWSRLSPVLDAALDALSEEDRRILLLRHLEREPFGSIGTRLGLKENTARMRAERALEKLRRLLSQRGVTSTAAALAYALEGPAITAAPAGLVASISLAAISGASTPIGFFTFMATITAKSTALTLTLAALGTAVYWGSHEIRQLRRDNSALSKQIASDQEELISLRGRLANTNSTAAVASESQMELLRLRGQLAHLLREKGRPPTTNPPIRANASRSTEWNPADGLSDRGTATPQDASVSFMASLRAQNQQRFNDLVHLPDDLDPATRSKQLATLFQLFSSRYATWEFTGVKQERVEGIPNGGGAIQAGKVDLEYVDTASGRVGELRVSLRKSDQDWHVAIDDFPKDPAPETTGP